jgi:hypothetical protein
LIGSGASGAAARLADRTRRIFVSAGEFFPSSGAITNYDASSPLTITPRLGAWFLRDTTTDAATATFTVPMDYVSGQAIPKITVYTGASATGQFGFDIAFGRFTDITNAANNGWNTRYSFYSGAGNTTGDSQEESTAIASANTLQSHTMPSTDVYANSPTLWAAGDIIVITITRRTTGDPNAGNLFILGVSFDYTSDM